MARQLYRKSRDGSPDNVPLCIARIKYCNLPFSFAFISSKLAQSNVLWMCIIKTMFVSTGRMRAGQIGRCKDTAPNNLVRSRHSSGQQHATRLHLIYHTTASSSQREARHLHEL